jgi:hypothetical protein
MRFFQTRPDQEVHHVSTDTRPEDTGAHLEAEAPIHRPDCRACLGTGKTLRTADWLRKAVEILPTEPADLDGFVAEFYRRLVARDQTGGPVVDGQPTPKPLGDQLAPLFPSDLTTGDALNSKGHRQRDMLLNALVGLLSTYDPDRPDTADMRRLVQVLQKAGRDHSAFRRPDGTVRGATAAEYDEVFAVLAGLLHDVFGDRWLPEFDGALAAAYAFAVDVMRGAAALFHPPGAADPGFGRTVRAAR